MGILIKGMEMPKKEIILILFSDGKIATKEYEIGAKAKAVEVPTPHGRLIDADALDVIGYCGIPQGREDTFDDGVMWLAEQIDLLPTIIPAEEGQ